MSEGNGSQRKPVHPPAVQEAGTAEGNWHGRRLSIKKSQSFEQHYRALVETSPDAIVLSDLQGKPLMANLRAAQLYGCETEQDLIDNTESVFDFIAPEDRARALENARITLETGRVRNIEYTVLRRDGSPYPAELSASLVLDDEGQPCAFIGVLRDISERKKAEKELAARYEELARVNTELKRLHRHKDEFIATVSHELRTPLVTGLGYLEMALAGRFGSLPEQAQVRLQTSLKNLRRLSALIDDIVDYHSFIRTEHRRDPIPVAFDLKTLITRCVAALLTRTDRPPDSVITQVPDGLPPVLADEEMIRRALVNLTDNAVRHAGDRALIWIVASAPIDGAITVTIKDDGQGIPAEIRDRVFEPFSKSEENREGSGLGLSIVRKIVEAHGSRVSLESEPGRGTSVSFSLPLAPEHLRYRSRNGGQGNNHGR